MDASKKRAALMVFFGSAIAIGYKFWKAYGRNVMGFDPSIDYWAYETFNTLYRGASSVAAILLCWYFFAEPKKRFFSISRPLAYTLVAYFAGFCALKWLFCGPASFSVQKFITELPFNFFTGFSEEFIFRGLIFFPLWHLAGFARGLLLSSVFFSLWHLDVTTDWLELFYLVFAGAFYAAAFSAGCGLFALSLLHFLWDQFVYGISWAEDGNYLSTVCFILLNLAAIFAFYRYAVKHQQPSPTEFERVIPSANQAG